MNEQQLAVKPIAGKQITPFDRVKTYMLSPEVKERFTDMMGANGIYYLNQVMILVANDDRLQQCTPQSILISAMRAASLRLSVDKSRGQAWIIAYKIKGTLTATFQPGYKGIYELAMRTGQYRFINLIDIYEGDEVTQDRMTGMHAINGRHVGNKMLGWMLYFQLVTGLEKTFYMTLDEIAAHAEHYSPGYHNSDSPWNNSHERTKMERKTVLSNGLRQWGVFTENDKEILDAIETNQEWIENQEALTAETITVKTEHTEVENLNALGYDVEPAKPAPQPAQAAPQAPETTPVTIDAPAAITDAVDAKTPIMTLETANAVMTNDKTPKAYGSIDRDTLAHMATSIQGKLLKHGYPPDQIETAKYKLAAIKTILAQPVEAPFEAPF